MSTVKTLERKTPDYDLTGYGVIADFATRVKERGARVLPEASAVTFNNDDGPIAIEQNEGMRKLVAGADVSGVNVLKSIALWVHMPSGIVSVQARAYSDGTGEEFLLKPSDRQARGYLVTLQAAVDDGSVRATSEARAAIAIALSRLPRA